MVLFAVMCVLVERFLFFPAPALLGKNALFRRPHATRVAQRGPRVVNGVGRPARKGRAKMVAQGSGFVSVSGTVSDYTDNVEDEHVDL